MDNLFDKMGLYDFWGTFVPGFIGGTVFLNILEYLKGEDVYQFEMGLSFVVYIIYSYLLGIFLHEIGHFIQDRIIYRTKPLPIVNKFQNSGEPFDVFLDKNSLFLSEEEKNKYMDLFQQWCEEHEIPPNVWSELPRFFFNYCDYYIEQNGGNTKASKMQSLYGMSRSLFVFFGLLTVGLTCYLYPIINTSMKKVGPLIVLCFIAMAMFYNRMKRFNIIRLKVVMRTYLVSQFK